MVSEKIRSERRRYSLILWATTSSESGHGVASLVECNVFPSAKLL